MSIIDMQQKLRDIEQLYLDEEKQILDELSRARSRFEQEKSHYDMTKKELKNKLQMCRATRFNQSYSYKNAIARYNLTIYFGKQFCIQAYNLAVTKSISELREFSRDPYYCLAIGLKENKFGMLDSDELKTWYRDMLPDEEDVIINIVDHDILDRSVIPDYDESTKYKNPKLGIFEIV
jgi:hypothetical protein